MSSASSVSRSAGLRSAAGIGSLGGASQQFELAVWFQPQLTARDQLASALNLAVARRLEQAGVKPA